ncbi:MAG: SAF domain-containing protein [Actinomycetota bacterium]
MKNYKRYFILAILGALIIGLAFYLFLNNFLDSEKILVFSRDIEAGETITEEDLCYKAYYKKTLPEGYLTQKAGITGKMLHMDRKKGDYASTDILEEKKDNNLVSMLEDNEVLIAIQLPSFEPILDELTAGVRISVVSARRERDGFDNFDIGSEIKDGEKATFYNHDYLENNTFKLSRDILLVDKQIIVRELEILDLRRVETSQNTLINNSQKNTNVYLSCQISDAPYLAKIIQDGEFEIIVERNKN